MFKKIICFLIASPALFLLVNNFPYLLITSVLIVMFLAIIFFLYKKTINPYCFRILGLLLIIFIYFILSYFFSGQTLSNLFRYNFLKYDGNFFFCYILFFGLSIPYFNYEKASQLYFKYIFFSFSLFSIVGIIEYFGDLPSFLVSTDDIAAGKVFLALNFAHNATGSVYAIVSLFALVFFLKEKKKNLKIIYLLILIICLVGLFITKSRGSYIGFMLGVMFVLWMHYRSFLKFLIIVGLFVLASLPIFLLTGGYERFLQIFEFSGTTTLRFMLWGKAWSLFSKSPLLGVGFGRFDDIFLSYRPENLMGFNGLLSLNLEPNYIFSSSHAHNSYFQFLAETGIIGLVLLIIFWVLCFRIIFSAYLRTDNDYRKKIYLSGLTSIVTLFILSLTENYLSATTAMICVSMIVSLSIGVAWQDSYYKIEVEPNER